MEPSDRSAADTRSFPELLADLIRDLNALVATEGRLLRAELSETARSAAAGAEIMAAGAILMVVALLVLVQALVIVLAEVMGAWAASLVVGGVLAVIGLLVMLRGRANLKASQFAPERTVEQTRRDLRLVKEQL